MCSPTSNDLEGTQIKFPRTKAMGLEIQWYYSEASHDRLSLALTNLLKCVSCKCKLSSKNPCGSNTCTCRMHGLKCVTACGECWSEGCKNAEEIIYDEDSVDSDDISGCTCSNIIYAVLTTLVYNNYHFL